MVNIMLICGLVLLISITASKVLYKFGVPILLIFIILGMIFGSDGIGGINFTDYSLTNQICSMALVFIMFYGGFGTNWNIAKPSIKPALLMSTAGVIITTVLTGIFAWFILKVNILEGLLIGAVVSSTDAASVFAILRSQKLNLEGSLASLLEVESGSNDPTAYMLTIAILTLMSSGSAGGLISILLKQIIFGVLVGVILAKITVYVLRNVNFEIKGFDTIFLTAIAILSYSLSEWIGGNRYLSVYLAGLIIGNSKIQHKKNLFYYFDGISWIMQIALFFILGLLSFPSKFPMVIGVSVAISVFLIFVARPAAVFLMLKPFGYSIKEKLFVSWVGLRGAASLVFAIYAMTYGVKIENDIFHIIFFVALFSVAIQGTLIPMLAKKLDLVDNSTTVFKTFNDYTGDMSSKLVEVTITKESKWVNKSIMEAEIPDEILIVMIKRKGEVIIPKGASVIEEGDILVLSGEDIERNDVLCNWQLIKARGKAVIIPLVRYLKLMGINPYVIHDKDSNKPGAIKFNEPIRETVGNDKKIWVLENCVEDILGYESPNYDKPYKAYKFINDNWGNDWLSISEKWRNLIEEVLDLKDFYYNNYVDVKELVASTK